MMEYSKYRDSGIPWIGKIPAHWNILRGKNILMLLERPIQEGDDIITCFRDGEVTLRKNRREEGFTVSMKEIGYQGVEPGDLVVHGMDGFAGAIGVSDSRGKATPVLNVMDSKENKRYLMYYLRAAAYKDVFMSLSTGIRVRSCDLRWNKLSVFPFLIPDISEQDSIVTYIDSQIKGVDDIISKAKASIEEYKSWKASIIYKAVTKGLDPNVEMKDSGVEWIGEIPKSWHITKIRNFVSIRSGITLGKQYPAGTPLISRSYLRVANVKAEYLDLNDVAAIMVTKEEAEKYALSPGELLMTEGGDRDKLGRGTIWNGEIPECLHQNHVFAVRVNEKHMLTEYLSYLTASPVGRVYFNITAKKTTNLASTNLTTILQFTVPVPSLEEQRKIVEMLNQKCTSINEITDEKQKLIDDLESYKKSLIFEVVTGKRRVV